MNRRWTLSAVAAALATAVLSAQPAPAAEPLDAQTLDFFEREVRPVLADRCFECHGVQEQESGLRLDHIQFALEGGETGPALVPGDVEASRLIEAIRYDNVDFQMPPRSKLPVDEIAVLEKWVAMGAPWPDEQPRQSREQDRFDLDQRMTEHWSWQPVQRPTVPQVQQQEAVGNAIDAFIVARLEEQGLSPSPQADRRTLIRRLYFDLIGLPPTPEEVDAFVNDDSPQAYENLVDRLLASPHFGERWARHWMDLVRYAEGHGHEFDYPIHHAWRYRNYLIRAFNDDVPYDQFVTEHIAGDLIDEPRINEQGFNESILGTGFYFLGEAVHSPVDVRADQADRIDNQIDVLSKTFVGLTVACARCHDHMFDAISTKDYYALYGIMASSRRDETHLDRNGEIAKTRQVIAALQQKANDTLEQSLPAPESAERHVQQYLAAAVAVVRDEADVADAAERHDLDAAMLERWVAALRDEAVDDADHPLHPLRAAADADAPFEQAWATVRQQMQQQAEGARQMRDRGHVFADFTDGYEGWRATGQAFDQTPTQPGRLNAITGGLHRPNVAHSGATAPRMRGVLRSPTFTIDSDYILYRMAGESGRIRVIVDNYFMDVFNGLLFEGFNFQVDTGGEFRWHAQDVSRYRGHRAHIEVIDDSHGWVALDEVIFTDDAGTREANPLADRLREQAPPTSPDELAAVYADLIAEAVTATGEDEADEASHALLNWALRHDLLPRSPQHEQLQQQLARIREAQQNVPDPVRALAITDGNGIDEHVFIRGSHATLGEKVPRRFLEAIAGDDQPPMPEDGSGRLQLARRITDPSNPFYSRVIVNRLWHHLFGKGIVTSVDDFGVMGTEPTHPELLDHLATRFLEDGQSIKQMIRLMVTSRTYRMVSEQGPGDRVDPTNQLLHRMPIKRLEGEAIRDAMLAISGRLDERLFGPSVEVHLTDFMTGRGRPSESGPLDGDGRRSIYTKIRRNFLPPMMLAFDMPIPFQTIGRRTESNVPAQALILLNDPFVVEQARLWAERVLSEHGDEEPAARVQRMYEAAYARPANEYEVDYALQFIDQQAEALGVGTNDAAVWADLAHVMMNVKEFIFVN